MFRLDAAASVEHDHDTVDAVKKRIDRILGALFGALAEGQIE